MGRRVYNRTLVQSSHDPEPSVNQVPVIRYQATKFVAAEKIFERKSKPYRGSIAKILRDARLFTLYYTCGRIISCTSQTNNWRKHSDRHDVGWHWHGFSLASAWTEAVDPNSHLINQQIEVIDIRLRKLLATGWAAAQIGC